VIFQNNLKLIFNPEDPVPEKKHSDKITGNQLL